MDRPYQYKWLVYQDPRSSLRANRVVYSAQIKYFNSSTGER
jgi:hypothetical protein